MYNSETVKRTLRSIAGIIAENSAFLSELDAAMGDGDLGIHMYRGFEKSCDLVENLDESPGKLLNRAGACFIEEAPSTLGTLMGLFIRAMGLELGDKANFSFEDFLNMAKRGYNEIIKRGKAAPGDKTILDSLHPAIEAMQEAFSQGAPPKQCIALGYEASKDGLAYSTGLKAIHGRPAYFAEKTIGMQDGGATVGMLLMEGLNEVAAIEGCDIE